MIAVEIKDFSGTFFLLLDYLIEDRIPLHIVAVINLKVARQLEYARL